MAVPADLVGRAALIDDDADRHRWTAYRRFFGLAGDEAALTFHWLLFSGIPARTRADGHADEMAPFPPLPFPRRMWAGGEIRWQSPIACGERLTRRTVVTKAEPKAGAAGAFLLASLDHLVAADDSARVAERQDIVFLPAETAPGARPPRPLGFAPEWREQHSFGPVDLFRYSALTFNGHRIHYDERYAREQEFYPGLVVHGPLLASHLVLAAARRRPRATPVRFAYRAVAPSFAGQELAIVGCARGDAEELAFVGPDEGVRVSATMAFA